MIKHLAAPMVAAFLMFMWIYSTNLGEIGDFDVTDIFRAVAGKYDLYDLLRFLRSGCYLPGFT